MLFDLKGKRRRAVQATYLALAILIGLGLIGFGVGSSINGGLSSIFSGNNGSGSGGNSIVQGQINSANKVLQRNPNDLAALREVIRGEYQLASANADPNTSVFNSEGRKQLALAAAAWKRYVAATSSPDPALAAYMVQAYSPTGLNQPSQATQAAEIVAAAAPSVQTYINVIAYASLAKDTRTVNLATSRALQLAPAGQRATVKQQIAQAKAVATQQSATTVP